MNRVNDARGANKDDIADLRVLLKDESLDEENRKVLSELLRQLEAN